MYKPKNCLGLQSLIPFCGLMMLQVSLDGSGHAGHTTELRFWLGKNLLSGIIFLYSPIMSITVLRTSCHSQKQGPGGSTTLGHKQAERQQPVKRSNKSSICLCMGRRRLAVSLHS